MLCRSTKLPLGTAGRCGQRIVKLITMTLARPDIPKSPCNNTGLWNPGSSYKHTRFENTCLSSRQPCTLCGFSSPNLMNSTNTGWAAPAWPTGWVHHSSLQGGEARVGAKLRCTANTVQIDLGCRKQNTTEELGERERGQIQLWGSLEEMRFFFFQAFKEKHEHWQN